MATIQEILDKINASKSNNINNNSFIDLMRQISGNPEDAVAPVNDTNSIYGHIVQMYTTLYDGGIDYGVLADEVDMLQGVYDNLIAINSVYADKTKLDSIYADKIKLDQLFADKAVIDRVYGSITNIDRVHTSIDKLDIVYTSVLKMDTVADNIADVNTVADNMTVLNEIYNNRVEIYAAEDNAVIATTKASEAIASATASATSASAALTSKNAAAASEASALTYKNSASTSATTATTKASEASASAAAALVSETNANTSKNTAATAATTATIKASEASTSASAAAVSASTSTTKASEASTSATTTLGYKNDVSTMKLAVETIYDTFDDRFLGTKTTNPVLDNDDNALIDGAMYFNTTDNAMKVYDVGTTTWYSIPQIYLSGLLDVELISITTGDILVWNGTKWSNTANPKVDSIQFNGGTGTEGTVSWNSDEGTLDLVANTTTLQIGQETYIQVLNQSGSTILDGTVVMAVGTLGASGRILVQPYDGVSLPKYILGIATESLANGQSGKVTNFGKIRGLDTSAWNEGDELFVTINGGLTNVEPATGINVAIAYVINSHASNGTIMVRFTPYDENLSYSKTEIDTSYGNINNTSDLNKPISTDTQTALDLKAPLTSAALVNPTINGLAQSGYSGFKNFIINGNFDIWQRGASQTSNSYGSDDRWANNNVGSTKTHSQVACTNTERALFNASYFSRTVVTSVIGASNMVTKVQAIENVTKLAGKTVTISFWAKADSNKNIEIETEQYCGSGGASSGYSFTPLGTVSLTTSWQKKTVTFTIPSIIGKTLGTDGVHTSYTQIRFWFDAGSAFSRVANLGQQSGTFDIAQVQLEEGSVATPFEQRPIGLEFSLCQRYYEVVSFVNNGLSEGGSYYQEHRYCIPKRITPTLTYKSAALGGSALLEARDSTYFTISNASSAATVAASVAASAEL